jgi:RimJ/RimL family protein N-acetyltransferase
MSNGFEGEKVRLIAVEKNDLDRFHGWANDADVLHLAGYALPTSRRAAEKRIEWLLDDDPNQKTFVIEDVKDGTAIGYCRLFDIDTFSRCAELAIVIGDKNYWDDGYGSDAVRVLLRLAFGRMNLHRVALGVYGYNKRAIRCYEKVGFVQEGIERKRHYCECEYHDTVLMSILSSEFELPKWEEPG